MIKENQGLLNKIHVVLDAVVIVISYVLSWYLRFRSGIFEMDPWYLSLQVYMSVLIFIIPGYLLLYYIFSVIYSEKSQRKKTGSMEYPSGEHDRLSGIYFSTLFQTSDRFFQNDDLCFLLY